MDSSSALALGHTNTDELIASSAGWANFPAKGVMFASCLFGSPMSLEFTLPEIVAVAAAVLVVVQISGDGESNWLEGALLLAVYAILAVLVFFCRRDEMRELPNNTEEPSDQRYGDV